MLDFMPNSPPQDVPIGNGQDLPKDLDIFYKDESEFLPEGKTFADLTPEEARIVQNKYRFSCLRPGMYQAISGMGSGGRGGSMQFHPKFVQYYLYNRRRNNEYKYRSITQLNMRKKIIAMRINDEEQKMVNILRKQHFINISELFRNTIRKTFEKFAIDNRKIIGK